MMSKETFFLGLGIAFVVMGCCLSVVHESDCYGGTCEYYFPYLIYGVVFLIVGVIFVLLAWLWMKTQRARDPFAPKKHSRHDRVAHVPPPPLPGEPAPEPAPQPAPAPPVQERPAPPPQPQAATATARPAGQRFCGNCGNAVTGTFCGHCGGSVK